MYLGAILLRKRNILKPFIAKRDFPISHSDELCFPVKEGDTIPDGKEMTVRVAIADTEADPFLCFDP